VSVGSLILTGAKSLSEGDAVIVRIPGGRRTGQGRPPFNNAPISPKDIMKSALSLSFILIALAVSVGAQTFIGGGVMLTRSSSFDPSPLATKDGGKTFKGVYVEGGYKFPLGLQARFLNEYSTDVALNSIFTSDTDRGKKPNGEFRFRPELRLRIGCEIGKVRPFIGGGVDYFRQRFTHEAMHAYGGHEYDEPAAGLNPFFVVGAELDKGHELSFSRLFADTTILNNSQLRGYRGGYSYTRHLFGRVHLRLAGEADYVTYRDSIGEYVATYDKHDAVIKFRGGLIFQ